MLQGEHSAILSTFNKLHLPLRSLFCLFLSGRLRQVLLYIQIYVIMRCVIKGLHCTLFEEDTINSYMNVINLQSADETTKVSL